MKKIKIIFAFLIIIKTSFGQGNEQEAKLTYNLAVEEYDKGNIIKASELLTDVLKLEPNSKAKVAYLEAKCGEKLLQKNASDDNYERCIEWINYYMQVGSDENKKTELLTLKIKIEHTDDYKEMKEIEGYTKEQTEKEILTLLTWRSFKANFNEASSVDEAHYNGNSSFTNNCELVLEYSYNVSSGDIGNSFKKGNTVIMTVDLSKATAIIPSNNINIVAPCSIVTGSYSKEKRFKKAQEDLANYLKGNNKNDSDTGFYKTNTSNSIILFGYDPLINYGNHAGDADDITKKKLTRLFNVLIKNCNKK